MATDRRPRSRAASTRSRKTTVTSRRTATRAASKTRSRTPVRSKAKAAKPPKTARSKNDSALPTQVRLAVQGALDKKAEQVHVLDLRKSGAFTDFFVIATGTNIRQVQAIADGVQEALKSEGVRPALVEGYRKGDWILVDYFDFIVHVFTPTTREFYALERLWGDAERVEISA